MSSITLYTNKACPYSHRVEISLTEANAQFNPYQIELYHKPEWYSQKVNPAGKVPAIAYGGPDVPPDDPSPESAKLTDSLVLIEFVADLFPGANLLPADPVLRAKARIFSDTVNTKFVDADHKFVIHGGGYTDLLAAIEVVQHLLPDSGSYALGDQYTLADISITPFVARLKLAAENELGRYPVGQGREFLQALQDAKYAKFHNYAVRLLQRPSFQSTFDPEYVKNAYEKWYVRK